jgi:hypothetical protein
MLVQNTGGDDTKSLAQISLGIPKGETAIGSTLSTSYPKWNGNNKQGSGLFPGGVSLMNQLFLEHHYP